MFFICLAPQYKIVISLDVIKITDKYCVSCHPPPLGLLPVHGLSVNVFLDDTFDVARK